MRLALAMGRTLRELEDSLGSDEWHYWLWFLGEYDLPDGYFVAGRVGSAFVESKPADHVPFYRSTAAVRPQDIAAKFAAAREVVRSAQRDR